MSEMHKRCSIFKNTVDTKIRKLFAIFLILLLAFPLLSHTQPIKAEPQGASPPYRAGDWLLYQTTTQYGGDVYDSFTKIIIEEVTATYVRYRVEALDFLIDGVSLSTLTGATFPRDLGSKTTYFKDATPSTGSMLVDPSYTGTYTYSGALSESEMSNLISSYLSQLFGEQISLGIGFSLNASGKATYYKGVLIKSDATVAIATNMPTFTISASLIETSIEGLARASETSTGTSPTGSNKVTVGPFSILPSKNSTGLGLAQLPIQTKPKSIIFVVGASSQPITSTEGFDIKLKRSDNIVLGTASRPGTAIIKSKAKAATSIAILTISCPSCQSAPSILDIQSQIEENAQNYAMSFTIRTKQPDELLLIITAGYTQVYNGYWTDRYPQVNGQQPSNVVSTYVQLYGGVWSSISAEYYLAHEVGEYKIDAMFSSTQGAIAMFVIELATQPTTTTSLPAITLSQPQINGLTITISGIATPGYSGASISRMHWDWGDGSGGDYSFPASHTYSKPGTYTITVTAYQSDGLSASKTITVTVCLERYGALWTEWPSATLTFSPSPGKALTVIVKTDQCGYVIEEQRGYLLNLNIHNPSQLKYDRLEVVFRGYRSKRLPVCAIKSLIPLDMADLAKKGLEKGVEELLKKFGSKAGEKLFSLANTVADVAEFSYCVNAPYTLIIPVSSSTQDLHLNILLPESGTFYLLAYRNEEAGGAGGGTGGTAGGIIVGGSQIIDISGGGTGGTAGGIIVGGSQIIDISDETPANIELTLSPALEVLVPPTLNVLNGQDEEFPVTIKDNLPILLNVHLPSAHYPKDALNIYFWTTAREEFKYALALGYKSINVVNDVIPVSGDFISYMHIKPLKKGTYHVRITASGDGVESTEREIEVNVYSPEDIIKNMVLKPSTQNIKTSDSLDVSLNFNLELSIVSSLENLGSVPAGAQVKPVEVTVELWEEREVFGVHFDKKIAEKSIELQSSKSTQNAWVDFTIHGSDLGWGIFHGGDHKLYAKVTVKYCIGAATCISGAGNNWGTIVVETPRVTVSVGS